MFIARLLWLSLWELQLLTPSLKAEALVAADLIQPVILAPRMAHRARQPGPIMVLMSTLLLPVGLNMAR